MFGRSREEDYEKYNERQNAKYDDDYIASSEEYREDCSHSHEQTYEDYNSELEPYEAKSRLEAKFAKVLLPGEYIVWCAEAEKNATADEKGTGCVGCTGFFMIALAVLFMLNPFFLPLSVILIITAVFAMSGSSVRNRSYAITDRRVLIYKGSSLRQYRLGKLSGIKCKASQRNIGYVTFYGTYFSQLNGQDIRKADGIFAVKSPQRVANLLMQGSGSSRIRSGSVING